MAVCLLSIDNKTKFCKFSFDNWMNDSDMLPNLNTAGKGSLSTIKSCCQGSLAKGTDGTNYILTGENIWRIYSITSSSGSEPTNPDNGFIEL